MNAADERTLLLRNLLSRLDADRESEQPRYRSVVSDAEREALRALLDQLSPSGGGRAGADPDDDETPGERDPEPLPPPVRIDETVLALNAAQQPEYVLCVDFGTAMSKAFACRTDGDSTLDELELDDLDLLELPLGAEDRGAGAADAAGYGDDDSIHAVVSSVWIDDGGLMFAGSGALNRGRLHERAGATREEFLASEAAIAFRDAMCREIEKLLGEVDESFFSVVEGRHLTLVLTGGGCNLPMIRGLKDRRWSIGGTWVRCRLAKDVPDFVTERFSAEFAAEYPQLAVAMGGAMPWRLDERRMLSVFGGDAPEPGRVETFPTRGI